MRGWRPSDDDFTIDGGLIEKEDGEREYGGESPFTILCDGNEGLPYRFLDILSDDNRLIKVKTEKHNLYVGDYAVKEHPDTVVERKTLADLFGSLIGGRENMEERVILMAEQYEYSFIVIEANARDVYDNPPPFTDASPKSVYRTTLSWARKYPSVHWLWCGDREFAEQTTYRILAQHHESRVKPRRKPPTVVDAFINAFTQGLSSRLGLEKGENMYKSKDPRSKTFIRGWNWASEKFYGENYGELVPFEKAAPKSRAVSKADSPTPPDPAEFPMGGQPPMPPAKKKATKTRKKT